jgi:hypothetical protein
MVVESQYHEFLDLHSIPVHFVLASMIVRDNKISHNEIFIIEDGKGVSLRFSSLSLLLLLYLVTYLEFGTRFRKRYMMKLKIDLFGCFFFHLYVHGGVWKLTQLEYGKTWSEFTVLITKFLCLNHKIIHNRFSHETTIDNSSGQH